MAPLCYIVPKKVKNSLVYSWVGDAVSNLILIIRASITSLIDSKLSLLPLLSVPLYLAMYY